MLRSVGVARVAGDSHGQPVAAAKFVGALRMAELGYIKSLYQLVQKVKTFLSSAVLEGTIQMPWLWNEGETNAQVLIMWLINSQFPVMLARDFSLAGTSPWFNRYWSFEFIQ
jgi:hypothetical protein